MVFILYKMEKRSLLGYATIYLRGLAMGAADVVPGVSGGTIAFISGIYQELLDTIKSFNLTNLKKIKSEGLKAFWESVNGNFIVALFAGIATSIVGLASIISGILQQEGQTGEKIALWSFFFGLVVASVIYVAKQVKSWGVKEITGLLVGGGIAYYVTIAMVAEDSSNWLFLFFAGALAISAMILPGISGSFILVLIGAYQPVMNGIKGTVSALKSTDVSGLMSEGLPLAFVGAGCIIGLLSFSRILSWLFKNQEKLTLATLTGFMIGSLNKIWPWKEVIDFRINSEGKEIPTVTSNLSPNEFESLYNTSSFLGYAIGFAIIGFVIVFGLEFLGNKFKKNEQ